MNNNFEDDPYIEQWVVSSQMVEQWIGNLVTPLLWEEGISVSGLTSFFQGYSNYKNLNEDNKNSMDSWPLTFMYANYYQLGKPWPSESAHIRKMASQGKAETVYRMLSYTLTPKTFLQSVKKIIYDRQYKTFKMDDLWDILSENAHIDGTLPSNITVKDIATSWIEKERLPFVTVTRNYNDKSALVTQNLYLRERPKVEVKDEEMLWDIPIVLVKQRKLDFTDTQPLAWMNTRELKLQNVGDNSQFIIVNPEEIAPYMVNYDTVNWNILADFLQSGNQRKNIPVMSRAKLIHDALNLAYAGDLDFGTALNVTAYLKDEREALAWKPFIIMFDHIGRHIDGSNTKKKYETYVDILTRPIYEHLKTNAETHNKPTAELFSQIKSVSQRIDYGPILQEASAIYAKWMSNTSNSCKSAKKYFCAIFAQGTKEQWEFGIKTIVNHREKLSEVDRRYLLRTLIACPHDKWKIQKFLNITIFEQNNAFTDDDIYYQFFMLTGGADGYMAAFDYLQDNWSALKSRFENKPKIWNQMIATATTLYKTQEGLDKVSKFYFDHRGQFGEAESIIQNGLIKIKEEVDWTNKNLKIMDDWLDNYIQQNNSQN